MPKPKDKNRHEYMFSDDMKFVQKAVVVHPKKPNTLLILRRSKRAFTNVHGWDLPGGNVLYGETHNDSILGEIEEETGLKIQAQDIKPVFITSNYEEESTYNNKNPLYYLYVAYVCTAPHNKISLSHEHEDYTWVTLDEVKELKPVLEKNLLISIERALL